MDEDLRRQIERVKPMTPDERVRESLALYVQNREAVLACIRHRHPEFTKEQVEALFADYMAINHRLEDQEYLVKEGRW